MEGSFDFEVFCPRCDVSFPVGTRKCLHCGARPTRERENSKRAFSTTFGPADFGQPEGEASHDSTEGPGSPPPLEEMDSEDGKAPRSGFFRMGSSVIWVVMAIVFSLMRMCQGE